MNWRLRFQRPSWENLISNRLTVSNGWNDTFHLPRLKSCPLSSVSTLLPTSCVDIRPLWETAQRVLM